MHINTLRISKYGPQPLLVEWRVDAQTQTDFHAAVVLPTIDKQPGYRHVATLRFPCGRDHAKGFESQLSVVERAARLLALQLAEEMAADAEHRAPVSVEPLETLTLRAAWSLGFYPGLTALINNVPSARHGANGFEPVEFERLHAGPR